MADTWKAPVGALRAAGFDSRLAEHIVQTRAKIDPAQELERVAAAGARAITWYEDEYPRLLKGISDPPPVLFVNGTLLPEDERAVTVVGTRRTTAYGREACDHLVAGWRRRGAPSSAAWRAG